jgi:hypothetical protein
LSQVCSISFLSCPVSFSSMTLQALFVAAHVIYPLNLRNSTASVA